MKFWLHEWPRRTAFRPQTAETHETPLVSILILTLNEESNIAGCLDSCAWSDDVVVFDSFSQDRTREMASASGARVFERQFDNYAAQRNAALCTVQYKYPWVLMVDADERVPRNLAAEVVSRIAAVDSATVMFRMRRKDYFLGQWLKRSSGYPTWFGRLVRIGRVRVERAINEEFIADGSVGYLDSTLEHFPFNKGITYWFERHNRYSTMEAVAKLSAHLEPIVVRDLIARDPVARRRALKRLLYRVPFRPLIVFLYLYVARMGLMDGRAGLYYSRMRAVYEFMIDVKVWEETRRQRGSDI